MGYCIDLELVLGKMDKDLFDILCKKKIEVLKVGAITEFTLVLLKSTTRLLMSLKTAMRAPLERGIMHCYPCLRTVEYVVHQLFELHTYNFTILGPL